MKLIFIFGPAAAGKLTVARALGALTGVPVFHNHLVVDALLEKLPFGGPEFVRLRDAMWMAGFETAATAGRDLIFTFAPEPTVPDDFPGRVEALIASYGGTTHYVRLALAYDLQDQRIDNPSRREFRKLTDRALLRDLRAGFEAAEAKMPVAELVIDTGLTRPEVAAQQIAERIGLDALPSAAGPS